MHRPRIVRDGGRVAQIIGHGRKPRSIIYAPATVEYNYGIIHVANVSFNIYFTRLESWGLWCMLYVVAVGFHSVLSNYIFVGPFVRDDVNNTFVAKDHVQWKMVTGNRVTAQGLDL